MAQPTDEDYHMGWLALRILNMIAGKEIELPKNLKDIKTNDQIVIDIGFAIAHICSDQDIVDFFQKLEDYQNPFSSDDDYADYVREAHELQEREADERILEEGDDLPF